VRRVLSRKTTTLITVVLDVFLVVTPIVLSLLTATDTTAYVPGFVAVILAVHFWALRHRLIHDIDERLRLAKLREISREEDSELYAFIDALTVDLVHKLERLKDGELVLRGNEEYWRFVTHALRDAKGPVQTIDVNTDPDMLSHWSGGGTLSEYYDCTLEVLRRGFSFTRIFVFKLANSLDSSGKVEQSLLQELRRQKDDGVEVLIAWVEDLYGSEPRISVTRDYMIFVGDKVIHAETPQGLPYYEEAIVTTSEATLRKYSTLHDSIRRRARTIEQVEAQTWQQS